MAKKIEEWEIQRYWDIFSPLTAGGQYLNGSQAASVLKNSGLSEDQLAKVWDLSDVDGDGALDFEEFCVAMRLSFDVLNGEYATIPSSLPDWLVPSSKAHLVQANRALTGSDDRFERPDSDSDDEGIGLKDGFDWYMPPADKSKYEAIYNANSNSSGDITFTSLSSLYSSLDVPDTDVRSAWNLVNPSAHASIGKDATLAFLHVLNNRHEGFRIPRRVPDSLRASFERGNVDFKLDKVQRDEDRGKSYAERYDEKTTSGRKAKFGDTYLSRMGLGGGGNSYSAAKGTDFSEDAQWEEVRLKKELAELDRKIEEMEGRAKERKSATRGSEAAVVRRELEQMLDYKRETLRVLDGKEEKGEKEVNFDAIMKDIDEVKAQIGNLEEHYNTRVAVLEGLREQIEGLQGGRRR